ncbi:FtsX-like permease family protein [Chitinophaga sp. SYP-B3965]|uniref:ABC transporter permease n=1 Tax=Chitinophaga sp. SYP-B3965 TaxID=2663120 RepID=UPI001299D1FB|nr:ABC transporter permease [Chitinophaga sp. SYP-B3965]MRG44537.1 FtsX-like permease family protein [Chitinophaga sp. SYP-B3965]
MIRNYLLTAYRNITRHKLFTFINIFGLALSMSVCMNVIIGISKEMDYDQFHPHPERTYRVITEMKNPEGNSWKLASSPLLLRQALLTNNSVAEEVVRIYPALNGKVSDGNKTMSIHGAFTEPSFFKVFGFELAKGNTATALQLPNSVVLSDEAATRFFGSVDPIGKIISIENGGDYQVTGVLKPQQEKSHIDFDAYGSASSVDEKPFTWDPQKAYTYVMLKEHVNKSALKTELNSIASALYKKEDQGSIHFQLQSLGSITPAWEETYNNMHNGGTWAKHMGALGIMLIILISACFNYTNLSIARSLTRAKEIGIRKVSGATRKQIFGQYIFEAVSISLFALGTAYLMLLLMARFNLFNSGYENIHAVSASWKLILVFLCFGVFTGLLAGTLPAWLLSAFKPVQVLKSMPSFRIFGRMNLRKSLLVFQFAISLIITIFLTAFYQQFAFMAKADPGFTPDRVVAVQLQGNKETLLAQELSAISGVETVAATSGNFGRYTSGRFPLATHKEQEQLQVDYYHADAAFISMMGLSFVEGNNFNGQRATQQIILNQKAAEKLKAKAGQLIWMNDSLQVEVAGIVKDFHFENLGKMIAPLAFLPSPGNYNTLDLKVNTDNKEALNKQITAVWNKLYPGQPLQISWLKEELFKGNSNLSDVSFLGFLAAMTIIIAAMGLLALVIYNTAVRRKEIGVRKVMGASISSIITLLSRGFLKLILIAACIALPVGYFASQFFLQNFAMRISFGMGSLLISLAVLLLIGLLTIVSQTWRAARVNPVESLKND